MSRVDSELAPLQDLVERYSAAGFSGTHRGPTMTINGGGLDNWYDLLHKMQDAKALPHILNDTLCHMSDDTAFSEDGLFCEWSYWINFENRTLETDRREEVLSKASSANLSPEYALELDHEEILDEYAKK
jgi:hypothetical protein